MHPTSIRACHEVNIWHHLKTVLAPDDYVFSLDYISDSCHNIYGSCCPRTYCHIKSVVFCKINSIIYIVAAVNKYLEAVFLPS